MNAPDRSAHMAPVSIEHLPIATITPSPTNPRKHFDQAALGELAANVKQQGIIQPIVVRRLARPNLDKQYEIVAGERRWRAAKLAGLAHLPTIVRELSDVAVLEIQITENLQRQDLDPMEEAEGYRALMALKKINADQLAEIIGKSRSYVYTRTKLNDLCPEARTAIAEGTLDASRALLLARIGHHDTQRQALKEITRKDYDGEVMSYRTAHAHIQQNYMLALKSAPFDPKDGALVPKAGPCAACPKRTGNQPELFQDIKSSDVCTDPKCFAAKREAHLDRVRKAHEAKGGTVIAGADAKRIFPHSWSMDRPQGGYTALDATCWDDPKQRPVRDVIGKDSKAIVLVKNPHTGALVEVVKTNDLTAALNAKGVKTHMQQVAKASGRTGRKDAERGKEEEEISILVEAALIQAIHDKQPKTLGRAELQALCHHLLQGGCDTGKVSALWGNQSGNGFTYLSKQIDKLAADKLAVLLLDLFVQEQYAMDDSKLYNRAAALKIDAKAIEKKIRAEFKAKTDAAKKAPAPTAAPKKKK